MGVGAQIWGRERPGTVLYPYRYRALTKNRKTKTTLPLRAHFYFYEQGLLLVLPGGVPPSGPDGGWSAHFIKPPVFFRKRLVSWGKN